VLLFAVVQEAIKIVTEVIITKARINLFILWYLVRYGIRGRETGHFNRKGLIRESKALATLQMQRKQ
jgi:hypothetical protein